VSVPVGTGSRTGRRAALRRRRRQRRLRALLVVFVVAVLALLAVTAYFVTRTTRPAVTSVATSRTQRTVLLQVRGPDRTAVASALLAHDPGATSGAVLLVPGQVLVNVPGTGSEQLGRALAGGPPDSSRNALADLLGVTVDDGWVLDQGTLGTLVDRLGGVQLDVDVDVVREGAVLVGAGPQRLDGARATAFATYLAPGEQEQARLARVQVLVDGILAALPATGLEQLLGSLGPGSVSTLPPAGLAAFLAGLAADDRAQAPQGDTLPVVPIDPGNGVTAFRLDTAASDALVDRLLAQSVPPGRRTTGNRVLVLNGVGTPGLGNRVRAKLVPAGFVYVGSRNAQQFGYPTTMVLVRDAAPADQELGARVARAIGVPPSSVATSEIGSVADVVVLVGGDFRG